MKKLRWIIAVVVVGLLGYALVQRGMHRVGVGPAGGEGLLQRGAQRIGAGFVGTGTEMILGVKVGDRIPKGGQILTSLTVPDSGATITPDAPIGLYGGAIVQGATIIPTAQGSGLHVLLGTEDDEETVLQGYAQIWSALKTKRTKPRASILYRDVVPGISEQVLIAGTGRDYMPGVTVARGPAIQPMDGATFLAALTGKVRLPLQPNGPTLTEIWLDIPLH